MHYFIREALHNRSHKSSRDLIRKGETQQQSGSQVVGELMSLIYETASSPVRYPVGPKADQRSRRTVAQ